MTSNENNRSSKMPIPDELGSVSGGVQSGGALNPLMVMLNVYL